MSQNFNEIPPPGHEDYLVNVGTVGHIDHGKFRHIPTGTLPVSIVEPFNVVANYQGDSEKLHKWFKGWADGLMALDKQASHSEREKRLQRHMAKVNKNRRMRKKKRQHQKRQRRR